jgi:ABC-type branched-subunit amino acid transport system ATPase component
MLKRLEEQKGMGLSEGKQQARTTTGTLKGIPELLLLDKTLDCLASIALEHVVTSIEKALLDRNVNPAEEQICEAFSAISVDAAYPQTSKSRLRGRSQTAG